MQLFQSNINNIHLTRQQFRKHVTKNTKANTRKKSTLDCHWNLWQLQNTADEQQYNDNFKTKQIQCTSRRRQCNLVINNLSKNTKSIMVKTQLSQWWHIILVSAYKYMKWQWKLPATLCLPVKTVTVNDFEQASAHKFDRSRKQNTLISDEQLLGNH